MRNRIVLAAILLFSATALLAQRDYEPDLKGYVTQISSPTEIDVNGVHIHINGKTQFFNQKGHKLSPVASADVKLYVGQVVQLYGKRHDKEHALSATQINLPARKSFAVAGSGVVDAVMESAHGESTLRADGYVLRIPEKCAMTFEPPLTAASAFRTNVWLEFRGTQAADGVVIADKVSFRNNIVDKREASLGEKTEHNPAAVDQNAVQSPASRYLVGIDPRQVPPFKDDAMQARVSAIGNKLIPKYQRELPDTDPVKINFRFQLVGEPAIRAFAWPNGIILVPRQVVERLQSDSQLAAVLAAGVALVMEKQSHRFLPNHKLLPLQVAGLAGSNFVSVGPGLALLALSTATSSFGEDSALRPATQQNGRVTLSLVHDAGYDIYEAPRAWWFLMDTKLKGLDKTPLPSYSEYLYKFLGETWQAK